MSRYLRLLALWSLIPWFFAGVAIEGVYSWMCEVRQVWWNIPHHWRMVLELSREILKPGCTARKYEDRKMPNKSEEAQEKTKCAAHALNAVYGHSFSPLAVLDSGEITTALHRSLSVHGMTVMITASARPCAISPTTLRLWP